MTNIVHLADVRARRSRDTGNVLSLDARRRHRESMARLAQDLGIGWTHTCPECLINGEPVPVTNPNGEWCPYCGALDHDGPKGAA